MNFASAYNNMNKIIKISDSKIAEENQSNIKNV